MRPGLQQGSYRQDEKGWGYSLRRTLRLPYPFNQHSPFNHFTFSGNVALWSGQKELWVRRYKCISHSESRIAARSSSAIYKRTEHPLIRKDTLTRRLLQEMESMDNHQVTISQEIRDSESVPTLNRCPSREKLQDQASLLLKRLKVVKWSLVSLFTEKFSS